MNFNISSCKTEQEPFISQDKIANAGCVRIACNLSLRRSPAGVSSFDILPLDGVRNCDGLLY